MTTTYICSWKIMDTMKVPCMTYFGSMTKDDDLKEAGPVEMLGRWSDIGNGSALCSLVTTIAISQFTTVVSQICDSPEFTSAPGYGAERRRGLPECL